MEVCRHLARHGVSHFAVASPWEGIELRKAGICSFIQIFGKTIKISYLNNGCCVGIKMPCIRKKIRDSNGVEVLWGVGQRPAYFQGAT